MRELDGKYSIDGEEILNTVSGELIPHDEPIMFFRARDRLALDALGCYRRVCVQGLCKSTHIAGIDNQIAAFEAFRKEHPERMKEPGITGHIRDYR